MYLVYIVTLYVVPLPIFVSFSLSHSIMFYNGKKITILNFVQVVARSPQRLKSILLGKNFITQFCLPDLFGSAPVNFFFTVLRNLKYCEVLSFFPCTYSRYKMLQGYLVALAGVLKCAYAPLPPKKFCSKNSPYLVQVYDNNQFPLSLIL